MEEAMATRYWCHMCSQMVNPVMEAEIKCPFCQSGFIEEMEDIQDSVPLHHRAPVSLWAPILMGMMNNPNRQLGTESIEHNDDQSDNGADNGSSNGRESDLDRQLEEIRRRRRRHSAAILQLLQGLSLETENNENNREDPGTDREREPVILINPFNQTIMLQGSYDVNPVPVGSLGDYFIGPGFDALLQRLAENDPNRYGTPPAQKEAVKALPWLKIEETCQCSVCLDDFEIGTEAREMPCKHRFHNQCLLPWLELHSSCPVCRYQLPMDEPKTDSDRLRNNNNNNNSNASSSSGPGNGNGDGVRQEGESGNGSGNGRGFSFPWPLSSLFSSSRDNSSSNSGSQSETGSRID
ncbi:PREDICTED: E3 ubiquitin-protein ligase RING1-like [Tarenaya hassleriana]|uniref:E3 ubiquitin-protein ligase RING1-like n=1 Tax=Tarenaya hassleriana TaxID=28532 RepID=UPI00053C1BE1|nr:PREDICTED: E3 ubiquitin-protein ligase RING1-like [Tarenaya hassleriana]XP_010534846.1 PREDICTED: E3 ubiquitin-protein ligase RING1-like [Tarenaya hassleriana]